MFLSVNFITEPRRRRLFQQDLLIALQEENEKQQDKNLEEFRRSLKNEEISEPPQDYFVKNSHFLGGLSLGLLAGMSLFIFQR
jgi:hypothetical protein